MPTNTDHALALFRDIHTGRRNVGVKRDTKKALSTVCPSMFVALVDAVNNGRVETNGEAFIRGFEDPVQEEPVSGAFNYLPFADDRHDHRHKHRRISTDDLHSGMFMPGKQVAY